MGNSKEEYSSIKLVDAVVKGIQEVKGRDIVHLDLRDITHAVTEHFVICNGGSDRQVQAISESVKKFTKELMDEKPWHVEGKENADWVLMDYVDVVVHIFNQEKREFYGLENLWGDAVKATFENVA
jgi:ribosome-associated protein